MIGWSGESIRHRPVIAVALLAAGLARVSPASAQEPLPYLDLTRDAGETIQAMGYFGWSAHAGRIEDALDPLDDVVACAVSEDFGGLNDVGVAHVFLNESLDLPFDVNKQRLVPANPVANQQLGRLSIVIANPRGPGETPLILISGFQSMATYCGGAAQVTNAGSVEIFDYNHAASGSGPRLSLVAPPNPDGGPDCLDQVPDEVEHFGHAIVLEDITRDGVDDVIVGAPSTDDGVEANLGRLYVFAGHEDFLDDPWASWIGVNAPESAGPQANSGTWFGAFLAVADLSQGAPRDVAVGRPDRTDDAELQPEGGTVVVFRGQYLHDLFSEGQNVVKDPVAIENLNHQIPEYQILTNPFGDWQPFGPERTALWNDAFGWFVFSVGDVGSPTGDFDGIDDIIVHAESTDYFGTACPTVPPLCEEPLIKGVGADFVFYGTGEPSGVELVHPEHVLLMTPANAGGPQSPGRFGRATARVDWLLDDGDPLTIDVPQPALVIAAPDANVSPTKVHAGKVYLVRLPLPFQPAQGWVPAPIENAWGATALTQPGGSGSWNIFGGWIVALNYLAAASGQPGQQLLISARGAAVTVGSTTYPRAGKFYTFTPLPEGP